MDSETLLVSLYCMVDDYLEQPSVKTGLVRPGPSPKLSDSELLTLIIYQEFTDLKDEDAYWQYVTRHLRGWFPKLVDRSQFNRRKRYLHWLVNRFRFWLLGQWHPGRIRQVVIDTLPVAVVTPTKFRHQLQFPNAERGYCAAKQLRYVGYKAALVVSPDGTVVDFNIGGAAHHDLRYGQALTDTYHGVSVVADKGFLNRPWQQELERRDCELITPRRKNMTGRLPYRSYHLLKRLRPLVETVNSQLVSLFWFDRPGAKSETGTLARLVSKLTAHTVAQYFNYSLNLPMGRVDHFMGLV